MNCTISKLFIYPIKSLAGVELMESLVTPKGLAHDRRWMLVDTSGEFMTQRTVKEMVFFRVEQAESAWRVVHIPSQSACLVPFIPETSDYFSATVWEDEVRVVRVSTALDAWFSERLGVACSLVYQPEEGTRWIDPDFQITGKEETSLSDGYPILGISEASLADISERIGEEMNVYRFRPNLVFSGIDAYAEDTMGQMQVGVEGVRLQGVKPCARCVLTTVDPVSGERGKEPLQTLAAFRQRGRKILFGQNIVVLGNGVIRVGDEVEIKTRIR
ncbi:MAG: MOSC domain-containing protein [Spirosomataceae bacterium]